MYVCAVTSPSFMCSCVPQERMLYFRRVDCQPGMNPQKGTQVPPSTDGSRHETVCFFPHARDNTAILPFRNAPTPSKDPGRPVNPPSAARAGREVHFSLYVDDKGAGASEVRMAV